MAIKCGHCTKTHETVPQVKLCAKIQGMLTEQKATAQADLAKVQIGTPVSLDDVLGDDVNPDPKALLKEWSDAQDAKSVLFTQEIDAAKVEIGTIVEDAKPVAVAVKAVPEHRIKPNIISSAQSIAAGNAALLSTESAPAVQIPVEAPPVIVKKGQDLDLGMYQVGETIYKVKFNKTGTHKYVEKLHISQSHVWDADAQGWKLQPKGKFAYANSMIYTLTSEHKMDEAAAKKFHDATKAKYGVSYGFCCVCGKLLTVKKSIDAGIGPVCAGKL